MKKILLVLIICMLLLTSCKINCEMQDGLSLEVAQTTQQVSSEHEAVNPIESPHPVPDRDDLIAYNPDISTPDFLTEEQKTIYQQAHELYTRMFISDTTGIEYSDLWSDDEHKESYETVEINGMKYYIARGKYRNWGEFDEAIHAVFTDEFWVEHNTLETGDNIYVERDGKLCILELTKGAGYYYNENFPETFELIEQTDTSIFFIVTGYYSPVWPRENETGEQRNERRRQEYEYTISFSIHMILTKNGWRFSEFSTAVANEQEM